MTAVVYLAAPAFLFLLGFCRPLLAWPIAVLLALALAACRERRTSFDLRISLPALFGALLLAWLTGFPAGPFPSDWIKHWALLDTIAGQSWPVALALPQDTATLRFYIGAYLVPAGLGKLSAVPLWVLTGLWFTLGFALVLGCMLQALAHQRRAWLAVPLLLLMAGADAYAEQMFRFLQDLPAVPWFGIHYEAWHYNAMQEPLEFSGILTALAWVPHQSIATFLVCALFARPPALRRPRQLALAIGVLAIWSPYGLIGMLPLALHEAWLQRARWRDPALQLCVLAGALFATTVAAYLSTELPAAGTCLACVPDRLLAFQSFLPFLLVELLPFAMILRAGLWHDGQCRIAVACLLLIPLMLGEAPDFVMRASLGPLFLLALRSVDTVLAWERSAVHRLLLLAALGLSLPTALSEAVYLRQGAAAHQGLPPRDPLSARWMTQMADRRDYTAVQFLDLCGWNFAAQYFSWQRPAILKDAEP